MTPDEVMVRCGLDPQWEQPEGWRVHYPLRSGRTTRMLVEAISVASNGEEVMLVGRDWRHAKELKSDCDEMMDKCRLGDDVKRLVKPISMNSKIVLKGNPSLPLVDHYALENMKFDQWKGFSNAWHRWHMSRREYQGARLDK